MSIKAVLRFIAEQIDGELFEYDDGYVIQCNNGTPYPVLFTYDLDGGLVNTKLRDYSKHHKTA